MLKKTTLVLAASALVLTACGGGGGGGSGNPAVSLPGPAKPTTPTATSGTADNAELNTLSRDVVAALTGAELYLKLAGGGSTKQFGGRADGVSTEPADDGVACGVYTPGTSGGNAIGTALTSSPTVGTAAFCIVAHGADSTKSYRHHIMIEPVSITSTAAEFKVTMLASSYTVAQSLNEFTGRQCPTTSIDPSCPWLGTGNAASVSELRITRASGVITGYEIEGFLPQTYRANGTIVNLRGVMMFDLQGNVGYNAGQTVLTADVEGIATEYTNTEASQPWNATFNAGSKVAISKSSAGGVGSIAVTVVP